MDDLYITEGWESYGFTREEYDEIQQCIDASKDVPEPTVEQYKEFRGWLRFADTFSYTEFRMIRDVFKVIKERQSVH